MVTPWPDCTYSDVIKQYSNLLALGNITIMISLAKVCFGSKLTPENS